MPPKGRATVRVTLRTSCLGRIQLPLAVRTAGSRGAPLQVVLNARSLGLRLEFASGGGGGGGWPLLKEGSGLVKEASGASARSGGGSGSGSAAGGPLEAAPSAKSLGGGSKAPKGRKSAAAEAAERPPAWAAGAAVGFGQVPVLTPVTRELRLRNPTVIPAAVKAFVEGANSVFEVRGHTLICRLQCLAGLGEVRLVRKSALPWSQACLSKGPPFLVTCHTGNPTPPTET